jgi:hypothetical protein
MRRRRRASVTDRPRAEYTVRARVWLYPGAGGWHFANLSARQSAEIRDLFGPEARGFGSLPVIVRIGRTEWETSLFPHRESGTYLFAIKAAVRKAEDVAAGDRITATVCIR